MWQIGFEWKRNWRGGEGFKAVWCKNASRGRVQDVKNSMSNPELLIGAVRTPAPPFIKRILFSPFARTSTATPCRSLLNIHPHARESMKRCYDQSSAGHPLWSRNRRPVGGADYPRSQAHTSRPHTVFGGLRSLAAWRSSSSSRRHVARIASYFPHQRNFNVTNAIGTLNDAQILVTSADARAVMQSLPTSHQWRH
jgi:hypothetical protein